MSCAKTDEPIEMPFGLWTWVGPRNHVLGHGPDAPQGKEICFGQGHVPPNCKVLRENTVSCTETADVIEMGRGIGWAQRTMC